MTSPTGTPESARARTYVVLAMLGFAAIGVLSREAGVGFLTVSFYRSLFVMLSFLALYLAREGRLAGLRPTREAFVGNLLPYGLSVALASTTFVGAYIFTSYANTLFLHNLAPLFVLLLAWPFFKEKARQQEVAGAGVGILGVACISGVSLSGFWTFSEGGRLLGDVMALASAVAYGLVLIYTRRVRQADLGFYSSLFWMWTVATLALVIPTAVWGSFALHPRALLWIALLALLCTTGPFILLNMGMRLVRASEASILAQSEVLFGLVLGFAIYGESLSALAMFGGVLIVCGILVAREEAPEAIEAGDGNEDVDASLPEFPILATLAAYLVALNTQAVTALLSGSGIAAAAVGLTLTAGLSLLTFFAENRWPTSRLLSLRVPSIAAALSAVLAVIAVAICSARAFALPAGAGTASWLAFGGLLVAAGVFGGMWIYVRHLGLQRPAARCRAALAVLVVALVGQLLAEGGFNLDRAFAAACALLALLLALDAFGAGIADLLPGRGRGLSLLAERPIFSPRLVRWGTAAMLCVYLLSGFFIVRPHQTAVALLFGSAGEKLGPGLHYAWPYPLGQAIVVDARQSHVLTIGPASQGTASGGLHESLMLTGDTNIAEVQLQVEYRITDASRWLFRVTDPEGLVRASAEAVFRELVATTGTDDLLVSARARLQDEARTRLQTATDGAGVHVVAFRVVDIKPPPEVMDAFLDVVSAGEDRNTSINQAYAYQSAVLPETKGESDRRVAEAQAAARALVERARGDASKFVEMLPPYLAARDVTAFRLYVETLEEGLRDVEKYLTDPGLQVQFRYRKADAQKAAASPSPSTVPQKEGK